MGAERGFIRPARPKAKGRSPTPDEPLCVAGGPARRSRAANADTRVSALAPARVRGLDGYIRRAAPAGPAVTPP